MPLADGDRAVQRRDAETLSHASHARPQEIILPWEAEDGSVDAPFIRELAGIGVRVPWGCTACGPRSQ